MPSPSSRKQSKNFPWQDTHGSVKKRIKWIIYTCETLFCSESYVVQERDACLPRTWYTASCRGGRHWTEGIPTTLLLTESLGNVATHPCCKYLWRYLRAKVFFTLTLTHDDRSLILGRHSLIEKNFSNFFDKIYWLHKVVYYERSSKLADDSIVQVSAPINRMWYFWKCTLFICMKNDNFYIEI